MKSDLVRSLVRFGGSSMLLFSAMSCDFLTGPRYAGLEVRSANEVAISLFEGSREAIIPYEIVNNSSHTVILTCSHAVEKRVGAQWVVVWTLDCAAIDVLPPEIAPGSRRDFTWLLSEHPSFRSHRQPFNFEDLDYTAEYRLVVPLKSKPSNAEPHGDWVDRKRSSTNSFKFTNPTT